MSRIFIKLATKGRPEKFRSTMRNIFETTRTDDYIVVVSIDTQDAEMMPLLDEINRMPRTAGYAANGLSKVHAINRDINLYIPWGMLVNMSDDMVLSHGWDQIVTRNVTNTWGDSTDYFYHCNDQHVSERLPTMSIMGREYYERFGYIYHPSYKSFSCDAEAFYVAQMLGKHKYFSEPIVEHRHPVNVRGNFDKVYKENDQHFKYDTELYFHRMSKNFYCCGDTKSFEHFKR